MSLNKSILFYTDTNEQNVCLIQFNNYAIYWHFEVNRQYVFSFSDEMLEIRSRGVSVWQHSILGVKLPDRVRNRVLRFKVQVVDFGQKAARMIWNWAGHICRVSNDLLAKTEWISPNANRRHGNPRRKRRDELDAHMSSWSVTALYRDDRRQRTPLSCSGTGNKMKISSHGSKNIPSANICKNI